MSRSHEYTVIILEIGSRYIRAGIAGDVAPPIVVETAVKYPDHHVHSQTLPAYFGLQDSALTPEQRQQVWSKLIDDNPAVETLAEIYTGELHHWLHPLSLSYEYHLYCQLIDIFTRLLVTPRRTKVILIDSHFSARHRLKILQALLWKLKAKSVIVEPEAPLDVISTGNSDGLVLDIGWNQFRLQPVVDLRTLSVTEDFAFTGLSLHYKTVEALIALKDARIDAVLALPDLFDVIERFIVNGMYVRQENSPNHHEDYEIVPDVWAPHRLRYEIVENLFFDGRFVAEINRIIDKATIDCRPILVSNIVITGGTARIRGFIPRVLRELSLKQPKTKLNPSLGPWIGASLYVSTVLINEARPTWKEKEITRDALTI